MLKVALICSLLSISLGCRPSTDGVVAIEFSPSTVEVAYETGSAGAVTEVVQVKNRGTKPVLIDQVRTSCHCTLVEKLGNPTIDAGTSVEFTLKLQPPSIGQTNSHVDIQTRCGDDLKWHRLPVVLRGKELEVPHLVSTMPPQIWLNLNPSESDNSHVFSFETIEKKSATPWITGVETSIEHLAAALEITRKIELDAEIERRVYAITFNPGAVEPQEQAQHRGNHVRLLSSAGDSVANEKNEIARIPVVIKRLDKYALLPSQLALSVLDNPASSRVLAIIGPEGGSLSHDDFVVTIKNSALLQVEPIDDGNGPSQILRYAVTRQSGQPDESYVNDETPASIVFQRADWQGTCHVSFVP